MASAIPQNCRFASFSYSFVVEWTIKGNELRRLSGEDCEDLETLSDLYQFKPIENLRFYLKIWNRSISIKGSNKWSFKLIDAFLVSKKRAFSVITSNRLSFLTPFTYTSHIKDEEEGTIHCKINACLVYPIPSVKEELILKENQKTVDYNSTSDFTLPNNYWNSSVIAFIQRGTLPSWSVRTAIQIIREKEKHQCEVLKVLCIEYLMKNITAQNLPEILKAAKNYGLTTLEHECIQKIIDGCFKIS